MESPSSCDWRHDCIFSNYLYLTNVMDFLLSMDFLSSLEYHFAIQLDSINEERRSKHLLQCLYLNHCWHSGAKNQKSYEAFPPLVCSLHLIRLSDVIHDNEIALARHQYFVIVIDCLTQFFMECLTHTWNSLLSSPSLEWLFETQQHNK